MKKKLIEIPNELFGEIQKLAKENERSCNKHIVFLLKKSLKTNLIKLNKYFVSDKESGQTLAIVSAENELEATNIAMEEYDVERIIIDKA